MSVEQARLQAAHASGGVSSSAIYAAVLDAAAHVVPAPASVLDFGSGSGQLLPLLHRRFPAADLHAIDIMEQPSTLPDRVTWHRGDLNLDTPIDDARFDLIVAAEVIEHLENPRHMIRQLARMLRPGGAAVLSTPNTRSLRSLITFAMRGHHAQFDDSNYPAHITPIADVDLARAGNEAGLILERFFYTGRGTIPKLLTRYWQDIPAIGGGLTGRSFSDNFGAVYRKTAA